jgi:hypothetical protein
VVVSFTAELQAANGKLSGSVCLQWAFANLVSSCFILFHFVSKKKFFFPLDWRVAGLGWPAFAAAGLLDGCFKNQFSQYRFPARAQPCLTDVYHTPATSFANVRNPTYALGPL